MTDTECSKTCTSKFHIVNRNSEKKVEGNKKVYFCFSVP